MRNDNSLYVILDIIQSGPRYRDNFFRHSHWNAHHARAFWHSAGEGIVCAHCSLDNDEIAQETLSRRRTRFRIHVDRGVTRNYRPVHVSHPESCRLSRVEHFSFHRPRLFSSLSARRLMNEPFTIRIWSCGIADITNVIVSWCLRKWIFFFFVFFFLRAYFFLFTR